MTDNEAQTLRETWQWWGNEACDHPKLELELNDSGYLTGDYYCTDCGQSVGKKY